MQKLFNEDSKSVLVLLFHENLRKAFVEGALTNLNRLNYPPWGEFFLLFRGFWLKEGQTGPI